MVKGLCRPLSIWQVKCLEFWVLGRGIREPKALVWEVFGKMWWDKYLHGHFDSYLPRKVLNLQPDKRWSSILDAKVGLDLDNRDQAIMGVEAMGPNVSGRVQCITWWKVVQCCRDWDNAVTVHGDCSVLHS